MKLIVRYVLCVFIIIALQACSGITVSQDYDQSFRFSGLKTFTWKLNANNEYGLKDNDLVDSRIRKAVEDGLSAKGYNYIDSGKPDFYISYHMTVEQKISNSNVSGGIAVGRGSYGSYGGIGIGTGSTVRAYDQGTLLVDVTEAASGQLVWRGVSTQIVSEHSSAEKTTEMVNATVAKMLEQFPPE
ncbi:MAG: hypothetical protein DRQ59_10485 [Gammaproteobacteria bacterium]|nr:MAG: hypothetical protein DRQ59_10485 [Gammaproteobacteria bacterium]